MAAGARRHFEDMSWFEIVGVIARLTGSSVVSGHSACFRDYIVDLEFTEAGVYRREDGTEHAITGMWHTGLGRWSKDVEEASKHLLKRLFAYGYRDALITTGVPLRCRDALIAGMPLPTFKFETKAELELKLVLAGVDPESVPADVHAA